MVPCLMRSGARGFRGWRSAGLRLDSTQPIVSPVDISLFRTPDVVPHTQNFDDSVVQSGRRTIRKEAERCRPDINGLCHEDASTISSGEHPCRRDSGPVRCELSMLRSLALSELASEADLGKLLQSTQMAHCRRSLPNIGAARAVSRVGPTTPKQVGQSEVASVDQTDARNDILGCVGRSHRSRLVPRDDIAADERGKMERNGLSAGPASVLGLDADSGRGRSSARPDHHRGRVGRGRQSSLAASPSIPLA